VQLALRGTSTQPVIKILAHVFYKSTDSDIFDIFLIKLNCLGFWSLLSVKRKRGAMHDQEQTRCNRSQYAKEIKNAASILLNLTRTHTSELTCFNLNGKRTKLTSSIITILRYCVLVRNKGTLFKGRITSRLAVSEQYWLALCLDQTTSDRRHPVQLPDR